MDIHNSACGGSLVGSGVAHTSKRPLIPLSHPLQRQYQHVMIRASKRNAGALYIDGHNNGERLCLAPGQEAQIEVIDIHSIYLLGDTEEAWYDWIAR